MVIRKLLVVYPTPRPDIMTCAGYLVIGRVGKNNRDRYVHQWTSLVEMLAPKCNDSKGDFRLSVASVCGWWVLSFSFSSLPGPPCSACHHKPDPTGQGWERSNM